MSLLNGFKSFTDARNFAFRLAKILKSNGESTLGGNALLDRLAKADNYACQNTLKADFSKSDSMGIPDALIQKEKDRQFKEVLDEAISPFVKKEVVGQVTQAILSDKDNASTPHYGWMIMTPDFKLEPEFADKHILGLLQFRDIVQGVYDEEYPENIYDTARIVADFTVKYSIDEAIETLGNCMGNFQNVDKQNLDLAVHDFLMDEIESTLMYT